jgi:glycosyltransferase involved in cell wall biosynthesis
MVKRAVVLVGGPAAPYARAIRIARALAAEQYDVEIAAVGGRDLPEREPVSPPRPAAAGEPEPDPGDIGPIQIRRYRPSGIWAFLGASATAQASGRQEDSIGEMPQDGDGRPRLRLRSAARTAARAVVRPILDLRRWLLWPHTVRGWWETLSRDLPPADLYHAFGTLAIAPALAARKRSSVGPAGRTPVVIYDAIDDALGSNAARTTPRLFLRRRARTETAWAHAADGVVTVNDGLAAHLQARWRLDRPPLVVPNYPEPPGALPRVDIRARAGLPASCRVVLFQGRLGPDLGLEAAADAVLAVPNAALVVLGFGRGFDASRARDRDPIYAGRHVTLPARSPDELLAWTAAADVAIIPLPPISANQRASTPNKFWEALAAGTPIVVVAGLTTMERLVRELDLGVVAASPRPTELATAITSVLDRLAGPDGIGWRQAIAARAATDFSWPPAATAYRAFIRSLSGAPSKDGGSTSQSS